MSTGRALPRLLATGVVAILALGACSPSTRSPSPGLASPPIATPRATAPTASGGPTPGETAEPAGTISPGNPAAFTVALEPFAEVPGGPLAMAAADDGTGRLFVAAQDGKVWVVDADGTKGANPAVDLADRLRSGGEQGLLGLALHPSFPTDLRVFVNYTEENGDTVVASLAVDANDPDRIDPDSHRQLLFVDQPYANHNGGEVAFGPDGYLYVFLGDGGAGGDPQGNGQDMKELLGKVLRLDIDTTGDVPYAIPADNPFVAGGGAAEIWLSGLRNPWRASFDRATGDLWIGDVGQSSFEEIDVARAGVGGLNMGWNRMEGSHCFNSQRCPQDGLTLPVSEYGRDQGCTVIGGYVYRGAAYPAMVGSYLFADYCTGTIFAIDSAVTELTAPTVVGNGGGRISAFGEDAAGELYLMNLAGDVSKLVATPK